MELDGDGVVGLAKGLEGESPLVKQETELTIEGDGVGGRLHGSRIFVHLAPLPSCLDSPEGLKERTESSESVAHSDSMWEYVCLFGVNPSRQEAPLLIIPAISLLSCSPVSPHSSQGG